MSEGENRQSDAQAVIDAARASALPAELDADKPLAFVIPENAELQLPDLRAWRYWPTRKIGTYKPATVAALIAYTEDHLDPAHSTVWVHPTSGQVVAVLNDNASDEPGWGDHRAVLHLSTTPEWDYWIAQDGTMLSQEAFAEHIEGGLEEIVEPDAATMLEIAQSFHATSKASFRSSTRLTSGAQRLQYDEEIKASAGASGDLTVPAALLLAVAPFIGEDTYKVPARLRFRLTSGTLTLGYKLDRPASVRRDALEGVAERLAEKFSRTFVGEPAA
jgi:uncharacterized protein YfdQ (DUF2303 family)